MNARRAALDELWHPAAATALERALHPAGHGPNSSSLLRPQAAVVAVAISEEKLFFIERKPENLRIFWLSLFTGKVVEINGILPLSACGRRAAEKMHLTGTARSVKKQFRNDRSRFGTANYKNNISAVYGAAHAEPF